MIKLIAITTLTVISIIGLIVALFPWEIFDFSDIDFLPEETFEVFKTK